jgi:hypothetical protein
MLIWHFKCVLNKHALEGWGSEESWVEEGERGRKVDGGAGGAR